MQHIAPKVFIAISFVGIVEAIYHAWSEQAFVTNIFQVHFAPFASLFGIPYWIFGLVWFPLIFFVGLWTTRLGTGPLKQELLILITVGNVFTGYLWYLDLILVKAYTPMYIALYATNYALTGLIVVQNWSSDVMHGYVYGTGTGAVIGLLFGPYGVAACGILGGIFGAIRNYVVPKQSTVRESREAEKEHLEEEKVILERKLKEIELKLAEESG
jgi:uncharacterized membrane protein